MSVAVEAFYLPLIMLTVTFLGGLRVAERVILMPPPLVGLVLAVLLLGILVRSGVLAPERLMNAGRSTSANLSGLVVLIATFLASAQVFNLATPESGLPRLLFSVFLFVLLLNTMAASSDRTARCEASRSRSARPSSSNSSCSRRSRTRPAGG